ncbi:response regulator transcription factor [Streptomyces yaizuensis]|uniref:Response regulator transcription factor n=1 Tax=Streptomyces yaizuensis TaxID=2989713 RepID=A0ABQ5PAB1_9ACTN|nr:response regulator transcription factor [Streptomyces sp. YSPA8]GLF99529.1 response regulator transcription factor [Streptomyces sp. YSPA8]
MAEITVVIVDDHPVFRLGMAALLGSLPGLAVVAEAATAAEAIVAVERHRPHVVVMDLELGGPEGTSGIDGTRGLLRLRPQPAVLVMTTRNDDDSVFAALRAGARGYLLKGSTGTEVERAVRAVANGEVLLGPAVADRAVAYLTGRYAGGPAPVLPGLTPREHEVLDLAARGLDNRVIAHRLTLSQKTVRNHLSCIFMKLHAGSRAEAIVRAREAGLGGER